MAIHAIPDSRLREECSLSSGVPQKSRLFSIAQPVMFKISEMATDQALFQTCHQLRRWMYQKEFQQCKNFALARFGIEPPPAKAPFEGEKTIGQIKGWKKEMACWILDRARFVNDLGQIFSHLSVEQLCREQRQVAHQICVDCISFFKSCLVQSFMLPRTSNAVMQNLKDTLSSAVANRIEQFSDENVQKAEKLVKAIQFFVSKYFVSEDHLDNLLTCMSSQCNRFPVDVLLSCPRKGVSADARNTLSLGYMSKGDVYALRAMDFSQNDDVLFSSWTHCFIRSFQKKKDRRINHRLFWTTVLGKIPPSVWLESLRFVFEGHEAEGAIYGLEQSLIAHSNGSIGALGKALWRHPMLGFGSLVGGLGMFFCPLQNIPYGASSISLERFVGLCKLLTGISLGGSGLYSLRSSFPRLYCFSFSSHLKIAKLVGSSLLTRINDKISGLVPRYLTLFL